MQAKSGQVIRVDPGAGRLTLARLVKSGGAGSVFLLKETPQSVAKLYHATMDLATYERKVGAMLALTPDLPDHTVNGRRYVQIAWPSAIVRDEQRRFVGFLMPTLDLDATAELEVILQDRQARAAGLPIGLGTKMTLAANLSAVMAALNAQHHYVVDLKPVNLRFYRDTLFIAMLDCDGFTIQGRTERFAAQQFTADYLAPEFQGRGVASGMDEQQDRFALAVVIFQLLNFGIHPYSGKPLSDRLPTDIPSRIAGDFYAYGLRGHAAISPNATSGHLAMPQALRECFDRAFGAARQSRPSAAEWTGLLQRYATRGSGALVACERDPEHQHFAGLPCAACARDAMVADARQAAAARVKQAASAKAQGTSRRGSWSAAPRNAPQPLLSPAAQAAVIRNAFRVLLSVVLIAAAVVGLLVFAFSGRTPSVPPRDTSTPPPVSIASVNNAVRPVENFQTNKAAITARIQAVGQKLRVGDSAGYRAALEDLKRAARSVPSPREESYTAYRQLVTRPGNRQPPAAGGLSPFEAKNDALRNILAGDPSAYFAALELANRELLGNRPEQARDLYLQAIWAEPDMASAWYGLGMTYGAGTDENAGVSAMAVGESLFSRESEAGETRAIMGLIGMRLARSRDHSIVKWRMRAYSLASTVRDVPLKSPSGDFNDR